MEKLYQKDYTVFKVKSLPIQLVFYILLDNCNVLKVDIYASHHRGFRHGEACIDFIALCQQVLTPDEDVGKLHRR